MINNVTNRMRLTLFAAGSLAAALLFAPWASAVAQERSAISTDLSAQQQQRKGAAPATRAQPRAAPQRAAPRVAAPRRTAPRTATPRRTAPRTVARPKTTPRAVTRPRTTPRTVTRPKTTPRVVRQPAAPRVGAARNARVVTKTRFRTLPARGAGRAAIRGRNYSVWRSGYRVRRGNNWRTFVALSTLGAIAFGATQYYPYAYVSAPQPYCEGLTEDGCQLTWQDVQTVEGDIISQCVAYCPWQ